MSNYFKFWHITAPVFVRPADTSALFMTPHLEAVTAKMRSFADTQQPLALLIGPAGSGKTTLIRWLNDVLPVSTHDVLMITLLNREQRAGWFLPKLASFFRTEKVPASGPSGQDAKQVIITGLQQLADEQRNLVVCIDAAHLLSNDEALADLEAFFNLQDHTEPRVSIMLAGAPELVERVQRSPALSLRVATQIVTKPLERPELDPFVESRLRASGVNGIFDHEALSSIFRTTGGNFLASAMALEKCLMEAAAADAKRITTFIVERALASSGRKQLENFPPVPTAAEHAAATQVADKNAVAKAATDQLPRKVHAEVKAREKNDAEKPGSIKLSSLFKQDDD